MSTIKEIKIFLMAFVAAVVLFHAVSFAISLIAEKEMLFALLVSVIFAAGSFYHHFTYRQQCAISYKAQVTFMFAIGASAGLIVNMFTVALIVNNTPAIF